MLVREIAMLHLARLGSYPVHVLHLSPRRSYPGAVASCRLDDIARSRLDRRRANIA